jgi:hypothetical protein
VSPKMQLDCNRLPPHSYQTYYLQLCHVPNFTRERYLLPIRTPSVSNCVKRRRICREKQGTFKTTSASYRPFCPISTETELFHQVLIIFTQPVWKAWHVMRFYNFIVKQFLIATVMWRFRILFFNRSLPEMNLYSICGTLRKQAYPFQLFYLWKLLQTDEIRSRFLSKLPIIVIYYSNFTDLQTVTAPN